MSKVVHLGHTPGETAHHHEADHQLKLGFWIFLASECLFFASLIGTYLSLRGRSLSGPGSEIFDIPLTTVSSFVLLMSSLTMVLTVSAIKEGQISLMKRWLALTTGLGLCFLGFQVYEFTTFYHEGLTFTGSIFGASFFTLTGIHGIHVAIGLLWLLSMLIYSRKKGFTREQATKVEVAGLYWHFVDLVWIIIFTVVYLMDATV